MTKFLPLVGLTCALSSVGPIAKITAVNGLLINGKQVPDKTAPTWPVMANDAVAATTTSAVLILPKGDRALLEKKTDVRVLERAGALTLDLTGGGLCLLINRESTLRVSAWGDDLTIPHPFEGWVRLLDPTQKAAVKPGSCHSHTGILAAAAAGAAAAATSVALATGQAVAPASPSRP